MRYHANLELMYFCNDIHVYINAAEILEVVLSPKDLQVKDHDSALLTCMFKSSTQPELIWENEAGAIRRTYRTRISTRPIPSSNSDNVSLVCHIIFLTEKDLFNILY